MNNKLKAALIAGIGFGIASGLPYIGAVNNACCALYIGGGVLAIYLFIKGLPAMPEKGPYGDGAVLGLLTGLFAGIAATITLMLSGGILDQAEQVLGSLRATAGQGVEIPQGVLDLFDTSDGVTGGLVLLNLVTSVVGGAIAACIGGLVGTAIFHKKQKSGGD